MALRTGDFSLIGVRLVAFSSTPDFTPSAVLAAVLGTFGKRFDGNVQVIPFPAELLPPNVPRIQLASKDDRWAFTAAPSYTSSSWTRKSGEEPPANLTKLVDECIEPILRNVEVNEVRPSRLALVVHRVCYVENPTALLIDRFCNDEVKNPKTADAPLRNSTNFEIHNHKRYSPQPMNITVNSWVRCRTGTGEPAPGITVEQDINTLSEEMDQRSFGRPEMREFFSMAVTEAGDILRKYFP